MEYKVQDFCTIMEELAPLDLAMEWDNVGLQIGDVNKTVSKVLVTLSVTMDVVRNAIDQEVDLVIAHHPLIFKPLRHIRTNSPDGALLAALLKHDIAVYVAHTNLDQADTGLNHWLAREVGLKDPRIFLPVEGASAGLGRIGEVAPVALGEFAKRLEALWGCPVRIVGRDQQTVSVVAVIGGSGGDYVHQAKAAGADVLVTGDVSYHDALDATQIGLAVLDAGHFYTERIMVAEVGRYLQERFGDGICVLQDTSTNPFSF